MPSTYFFLAQSARLLQYVTEANEEIEKQPLIYSIEFTFKIAQFLLHAAVAPSDSIISKWNENTTKKSTILLPNRRVCLSCIPVFVYCKQVDV